MNGKIWAALFTMKFTVNFELNKFCGFIDCRNYLIFQKSHSLLRHTGFSNILFGNLLSCQIYTAYSKNYAEAVSNLMTANFFRSRITGDNFNIYFYSDQLKDWNVYSVTHYYSCFQYTKSLIDLFLDVHWIILC